MPKFELMKASCLRGVRANSPCHVGPMFHNVHSTSRVNIRLQPIYVKCLISLGNRNITLMVDILPDPSVRRAMNVINAAQRLRLASIFKGEAEAKYLGGVGVARQRQAITDGLKDNIPNLSHTYFDTIKDLGDSSKNTTIFILHGPGHVRDITDQMRNGMMEASTPMSTLPRPTTRPLEQTDQTLIPSTLTSEISKCRSRLCVDNGNLG
ncbi:unnamed protein product [Spirodela intermedia]|uniref:Uncharacterized protein n=1 Tax=Spirodela intermedia TaxID=51605 RepID=A0A7I8JY84_SPIIN|nr:unnamed protein product [Spirodela intermedia]